MDKMTQIRCEKTDCNYNYNGVCTADGITIDSSGKCLSYEPVGLGGYSCFKGGDD